MTINKACLGHGIFTELSVTRALARYTAYVSPNPAIPHPADSIDRFINAIIDMNIAYVWIQLFSHGRDYESGTSGSPSILNSTIRSSNMTVRITSSPLSC